MYWLLNQSNLSRSKIAPDLFNFSSENSCSNSERLKISCSVFGFQPSSARKLIIALGKYPFDKKSLTATSPSRLDNFFLVVFDSTAGRWTNTGNSQPKAR